MPKYDPPYLKRPLVNPAAAAAAAAAGQIGGPKPTGMNSSSGSGGAGPSAMPGPSGSQQHGMATANHTPSSAPMSADALCLEAGAKGIPFGNPGGFS